MFETASVLIFGRLPSEMTNLSLQSLAPVWQFGAPRRISIYRDWYHVGKPRTFDDRGEYVAETRTFIRGTDGHPVSSWLGDSLFGGFAYALRIEGEPKVVMSKAAAKSAAKS